MISGIVTTVAIRTQILTVGLLMIAEQDDEFKTQHLMLKNFKMVKFTYSCCYFFCIKKAETRKQCDKMIKTKIVVWVVVLLSVFGQFMWMMMRICPIMFCGVQSCLWVVALLILSAVFYFIVIKIVGTLDIIIDQSR